MHYGAYGVIDGCDHKRSEKGHRKVLDALIDKSECGNQ